MKFLAVVDMKPRLGFPIGAPRARRVRRFMKFLDISCMLCGGENLACAIEKSHIYHPLLDRIKKNEGWRNANRLNIR